MRLIEVTAAELAKVRTLPAAVLAVTGTVLAGGALAAALAASATAQQPAVRAVDVVARAVPFLQAGLVLVGVLPAAHEYAGRQIRTTLTAVPSRGLALAAKTLAVLVVSTTTAVATIGVGLATALARLPPGTRGPAAGDLHRWAGAVLYLVLIALLAHAAAVLARALTPALVTVLGLLLVASPVLGAVTEHARWLPDRAGGLLYLGHADGPLTPTGGGLVTLAYVVTALAVAASAFVARDSG